MSFQKGDRINVLEQNEMLWVGELNGKTGTFPKSYVKLVDGPRRGGSGSRPPSASASLTSPTEPKKDIPGEWYVSTFPFEQMEAGDLAFSSGERLLVLQKDGDWWTGKIGDRTGIFPANYVQKEGEVRVESVEVRVEPVVPEESQATAPIPVPVTTVQPVPTPQPEPPEIGKVIAHFSSGAANQISLEPGDLVRIHSKSPSGWWEGELQKKGQEKKTGWFPGNYVQMITQKPKTVDGLDEVHAVYDYVAQQEDELSFSRGDAILILQKVDEDWWKGRRSDGKEGMFPANYVQKASR